MSSSFFGKYKIFCGQQEAGAHDGGGDGDTGAGAVLGHGTLGEVDMDVPILVEIGIDSQLSGVGADVGHSSPGALLHHQAQCFVWGL